MSASLNALRLLYGTTPATDRIIDTELQRRHEASVKKIPDINTKEAQA